MMYVRFPLSLRNVEDLLHERDISHETIRAWWLNNRAENSHLRFRRRERAMSKFRGTKPLQKFISIHSSVHNHFNQDRHLNHRKTFKEDRATAVAEWRRLAA